MRVPFGGLIFLTMGHFFLKAAGPLEAGDNSLNHLFVENRLQKPEGVQGGGEIQVFSFGMGMVVAHGEVDGRDAHLYYRENSYHRAAFHFMEALRHGWERGLTDTQKMLSHMLLVNCGLDMMKESLSRLREMEESLSYDETLVEKYREMVYLTDLDHLHRALYRIITPQGERIVTEETYFRAQDEQGPDEVDLEISHGRMGVDHELVVRFRQEAVPLDYKQFFLVAYLLHAEEPLTYEKILTRYYWGFLKEKVQADTVRQTLRRINRKIFFFDQIMETAMAGGKAFLRRKEGIAYRIFCRASDLFPWEMEGEYT